MVIRDLIGGKTMAILTPALTRLRSDFNTAFPQRDKASDGWIGDIAHQSTSSGHNPDETGNSEYQDPDNIDEVRAIDVDSDLRDPRGVSMQDVINRILAAPDDLRRLRYIIYNRSIWRKATGWSKEAYTGTSPHTEHAHFSGDPFHDDDNGPWSVLQFKESIMTDFSPTDINAWTQARRTEAWALGLDHINADAGGAAHWGVQTAKAIKQNTDDIKGMMTTGGVTQEMLNLAFKTALLDSEVLAAMQEAAFQGAQRAERE